MNIWYYTLGCKVNQYETEHIRTELESVGYSTVESGFDIAVINTCAVTGDAVSKTRALIRKARTMSPDAFIIITGCSSDFCPGLPYDLSVPMSEKANIPNIIRSRFPIEEHRCTPELRERTRAVVKVQEGCNQFCSYCIIPYLRNYFHSVSPESAVSEVRSLVDNGFTEIVLTGIRLGSYRSGENRLEDLISLLLTETDIRRIRLSSIEAWEITPGLLELMNNSRMAKHLHIPLQSGAGSVLKAMNRPYDPEQYRELIDRVRGSIDNMGITTDVIVGFPGESDEDFEESLSFIESIGFSRVHSFRFSPRKGTKAFSMPGQIEQCVKKERAHALMALADRMKQSFALANTGKKQEVIFETRGRDGMLRGYTSNYLDIHTERDCETNRVIEVVPERAEDGVLVW